MTKQQMKVIAQAEHEMFCLRDLLEGSVPAKVMNRAYEYVIKQDLLSGEYEKISVNKILL